MPVRIRATKVCVLCTVCLRSCSVLNGFLSWQLNSNSIGQPRCRSCFSCKGTSICLAASSLSLSSQDVPGCILTVILSCLKMSPSATRQFLLDMNVGFYALISQVFIVLSWWHLLLEWFCSTAGDCCCFCGNNNYCKVCLLYITFFFFSFVTRSHLKDAMIGTNIN